MAFRSVIGQCPDLRFETPTKTPKPVRESCNSLAAPSRDSKAVKLNRLASKMESILEDLPPDRNIEPKRY